MEVLTIEKTAKTPFVVADPEKGVIEIIGRSNPENSVNFYLPLIKWIEEFTEKSLNTMELHIDLEYFNTSTSKSLMIIIKYLRKMSVKGRHVKINWYYEEDDEEMFETAEIFKSLSKIDFEIQKKKISGPHS